MKDYPVGAPESPNFTPARQPSAWTRKYGERHRIVKVSELPAGVAPLKRAHIYRRRNRFLIQWWDSEARENVSRSVDGDLVDAIAAAREIDRQLEAFKTAGQSPRKLSHEALVAEFLRDLHRRADANEITPATVERYRAALDHYQAYAAQAENVRGYPLAARVDRRFALEFASWLNDRQVSPNGHANARLRAMRGQAFVIDTARAMFEWAADPHRGNCLPRGFVNPFLRATLKRRQSSSPASDSLDITIEMAVRFFRVCAPRQRPMFLTMLACGLRASEPIFLFRELIRNGRITIGPIPGLSYTTKGLREKGVPLIPELAGCLQADKSIAASGLLFHRERVAMGIEKPPLLHACLTDLVAEFDRRVATAGASSAAERIRIRNRLMRDAGALTYDLINNEFRRVADELDWPTTATLKDFRHLFATSLANGGMPEHERRYLMGHAPGRDAINIYTHMDQLASHYNAVVATQWQPILDVLEQRAQAG